MSEYVHKKVVRFNISDDFLKRNQIDTRYDLIERLEECCQDVFGYGRNFNSATTDANYYIDYVLVRSYDMAGEFGRCRKLYPSETQKYAQLFNALFTKANLLSPAFDTDDLRLIEICYYNCCEETDYWDAEDDFMKEV